MNNSIILSFFAAGTKCSVITAEAISTSIGNKDKKIRGSSFIRRPYTSPIVLFDSMLLI
jgi:hypothetical protein